MSDGKFYVTTPLYYVNSELHVGSSYTTIAADILARYHRSHGKEVFFLTGSDEHGQKILRAATEKGMKPREFADSIVATFKDLWKDLGIEYDFFIRTTDADHERRVVNLFKKLMDQGDIYLGRYEGPYCTFCETYIKPSEAVDGNCPSCHRPTETIVEQNYFFRLSKYGERILKHIDANPNFILPAYRRNEIRNRIEAGLDDISVSRSSFDWGIPVPGDPHHIIYVWFDALLNYISALGASEDETQLRKWWPADVHLMAKDILWFHTVIWGAMLMALGYELPKKVFAHGYWTINADKISKSKGNIIYPRDVTGKYGRDALRFFMFKEMPFGRDGDFSMPAVDSRYHTELGNCLGNLVMRSVSMVERYFGGIVPEPSSPDEDGDKLAAAAEALAGKVSAQLENLALGEALDTIWEVVRDANKYVEQSAPWTLAKRGETDKLATVMYYLIETCRLLLVNLYPYLPDTFANGMPQLGASADTADLRPQEKWGLTKPGTKVSKGAALFPRIEEKKA
ncbi:MAG: methionine--tRNA ligase [Candidatus Brocadiia bacterium]